MSDPAPPDIFAIKRETVDATAPDAAERLRAMLLEYNRSYADVRGNLHARRQGAAGALRALGFETPEDVPKAAKQFGGPGVTRQTEDLYSVWLYSGALLARVDALGEAITPEINSVLVLALSVGEDCFRAFARKVEPDVLHVRGARKTAGRRSSEKQKSAGAAHDERFKPLYQEYVDELLDKGEPYGKAVKLTAEYFRRKYPDGRARSRHSIDRVRNLTKR